MKSDPDPVTCLRTVLQRRQGRDCKLLHFVHIDLLRLYASGDDVRGLCESGQLADLIAYRARKAWLRPTERGLFVACRCAACSWNSNSVLC